MFFLGVGENCPDLDNPDYDFPDELIAVGASVFMRTLRICSDEAAAGSPRGARARR
jgi:hypothetical protein